MTNNNTLSNGEKYSERSPSHPTIRCLSSRKADSTICYYNDMNNMTREMKERYSPLRFSQSAPRIEHDRRGIPRKIGLYS